MKSSAEIVICGAGIAGLSTAYMLAFKHFSTHTHMNGTLIPKYLVHYTKLSKSTYIYLKYRKNFQISPK